MTTTKKPLSYTEIKMSPVRSIKTGIKKFDDWFSRVGGMIRKSVVFVTGTSGAGKTTLMWNIIEWLRDYKSAFYARESDLDEIKDQLLPFKISHNNALLMDGNTHPTFKDFMQELHNTKPLVVIVDSLQAIASSEYRQMGLTKDEAADFIRQELTSYIKGVEGVLFLIGHNTKEGEFAGKNMNMQMVDAHMVLEYDKKENVRRIYWGQKNRKGPMTKMFYELNDGKVTFFNIDEYKIEAPEEENLVVTNKPFKVQLSSFIKSSLKQFEGKPNYDLFKKDFDASMSRLKRTIGKDDAQMLIETIRVINLYANHYGF